MRHSISSQRHALKSVERFLRRNYPYGIPKELVDRFRTSCPLLFVGMDETREGRELLDRAIEFGLKMEGVPVVYLDEESDGASVISKFNPDIVIILGQSAADHILGSDALSIGYGRLLEWKGFHVIVTLSPTDVSKHPEKKRTFWEHLKVVLAELNS
ncbi:MAG: hypothetical protein D6808_06795 [Candidatus Dadabacteria bacterium]|nr:MAG: hypothetical protein D6808_06795 [Candidatus Dadabacteria bacterium]